MLCFTFASNEYVCCFCLLPLASFFLAFRLLIFGFLSNAEINTDKTNTVGMGLVVMRYFLYCKVYPSHRHDKIKYCLFY